MWMKPSDLSLVLMNQTIIEEIGAGRKKVAVDRSLYCVFHIYTTVEWYNITAVSEKFEKPIRRAFFFSQLPYIEMAHRLGLFSRNVHFSVYVRSN
jgi:hypothetical protein